MTPTQGAQVPSLYEALRYFWRLLVVVREYWRRLLKGIALGMVVSLLGMFVPLLTKVFIDDVYPSRSASLLSVLVVGIFAITIAIALVGAIQNYYTQAVSGLLTRAMTLLFFNHIQHLPVRFFDTHRVGEINSRFNDVRTSLSSVSRIFQTLLVSGLYTVLVPPVLLMMQWRLGLLTLVTLPITTTISVYSGRQLRRYWKRSAEAQAEFSAIQVDVLSHIRTVKLASAERSVYERAKMQIQDTLQVQLRASALSTGVGLLNGVIKAGGMGLYTWYAWTLILRQQLTLGEFMAFSAYVGYMAGPVTQMASLFSDFQQSSVALGRMFEYLDSPPETDPTAVYSPRRPVTNAISGTIEFRNITFGYSPDRLILQDVSFAAKKDTVTAIVGPSGAGKSSLLRLLSRMDSPMSGAILIDGVRISSVPLEDLRRQVAVVWQEVGLMRGSIWDNLTLGIQNPSSATVDRAIRLCRLEDVIGALPEGLETPVSEWGASLSAGQRQRIALARAVIRDTPILVLDEATANIDLQTEAEMLGDLFAATNRKTIIFVTHRLTTAAMADSICVLEAGRIVGFGAHQELLSSNDAYRQMQHASGGEARRLRMLGGAVT